MMMKFLLIASDKTQKSHYYCGDAAEPVGCGDDAAAAELRMGSGYRIMGNNGRKNRSGAKKTYLILGITN